MVKKTSRGFVMFASAVIFFLCLIAGFILIWFSLSKNDFKNNYVWFALGLYFLAKAVFCSTTLRLLSEIGMKNSK